MQRADQMVAAAMGDNAKDYPSLTNERNYDQVIFAKTSALYQQIMEDGYIFNPYIHRRWLPKQYIKMCERNKDVKEEITNCYSHRYSVHYVIEEVFKLEMMSKYSRKEYEERRQFFTVPVIKEVLMNHAGYLENEMKTYYGATHYTNYLGYLGDGSVVLKEEYDLTTQSFSCVRTNDPVFDSIEDFKRKLAGSDTYFELSRALCTNKIFMNKIRKDGHDLDECFVEAFWKAGAYYTIKHAIMFQGKKLVVNGRWYTGAEAYQKLRELLDSGKTAIGFHLLCLQVIDE